MKEMNKAKIYIKKSMKAILNEKNLLEELHYPLLSNMNYAFQTEEFLYIIMDYLPGGDLRYHLSKRKKYNQSDYLFLTKLFQVSENYNDMIKAINKYIELNPKLTKEEKKLFCIGYKNIISNKRNSFQILLNLLSKEDPKHR